LRVIKYALIAFVVIAVAILLFKDVIVRVALERMVEVSTGTQLTMKSLRIGLLKPAINIEDLKILNPKGFKDRLMMDVPEIYIDYQFDDIFTGKAYFDEMRLDIKEFVVIVNEKGEVNLNSLNVVKEGKVKKTKAQEASADMKINVLYLKVSKVIFKDYSKGSKPVVHVYHLKINEKFTNITDGDKLMRVIVVRSLMNTPIANLTNFSLSTLRTGITGTLNSAEVVAATAVTTAGKVVIGASGTAKEAIGVTSKTLGQTTKTLEGLIVGPFGGSKEKK